MSDTAEAEAAQVKDPTVAVSVLLSGITNRIKDALGQGDYAAVADIVRDVDTNNQKYAAAATSIPEPEVQEPEPVPEPESYGLEPEEAEAEEAGGYGEYTVEELKEFLRERDLPVSGSKEELVERLEEADKAEG
jgi:hypothetical protein